MSGFFEMGGYGAYVWPAYGISALAVAGLAFAVWRRGRDLKRRIAAAERRLGAPEPAAAAAEPQPDDA